MGVLVVGLREGALNEKHPQCAGHQTDVYHKYLSLIIDTGLPRQGA